MHKSQCRSKNNTKNLRHVSSKNGESHSNVLQCELYRWKILNKEFKRLIENKFIELKVGMNVFQ